LATHAVATHAVGDARGGDARGWRRTIVTGGR
jgi:hypothetical protein